jgi:hypothetical protein
VLEGETRRCSDLPIRPPCRRELLGAADDGERVLVDGDRSTIPDRPERRPVAARDAEPPSLGRIALPDPLREPPAVRLGLDRFSGPALPLVLVGAEDPLVGEQDHRPSGVEVVASVDCRPQVSGVEQRTTCGEGHDVIDRQVDSRAGVALIARTPVAVLTTLGAEHAGAESLPGPRGVERVVPAAVGLAGVLGAATTSAARDDTADRAQLHPRIVGGLAGEVYSPVVLGLRGHGGPTGDPTKAVRGRTDPDAKPSWYVEPAVTP